VIRPASVNALQKSCRQSAFKLEAAERIEWTGGDDPAKVKEHGPDG
jgi:hypothetical protein